VENQHCHDHRHNQRYETAGQSQSQALSPKNGQLTGVHIAPVPPNSQNTRRRERLRRVPFVISQSVEGHRAAAVKGPFPPEFFQQTPFAFEPSDDGDATESNEYQAGDGEEATSGQERELTR
jgi:hypothetical protein